MYEKVNVSEYMDSYNETLLDMIWKHKIKLIGFILFAMVGYMYIPRLEKVQQTLKYKEKFPKNYLNAKQIKDKKNSFHFVVDTRTKEEYDTSHVEDGIHIEYKDILSPKGKKILKDHGITKHKKVLLYCNGGNRSQQSAAHMVDSLGYKQQNIYLTNENDSNIDVSISKTKVVQ